MTLTASYVYAHKAKIENITRTKKKSLSAADTAIIAERLSAYNTFIGKLSAALASNDYEALTSIVNQYMDYAKNYENEPTTLFPTRSKYYSSILEELPVHFVKPTLEKCISGITLESCKALTVGSCDCVIRIGINPNGDPFYETKSIDFAISVRAVSSDAVIQVPLLGLEVKRYLDKTMFGTVLETYKSLGIFRPRTYYGFLVEDESRGEDVILNSQMHKTEFVLTGCKRPEDDHTRNPILKKYLEPFITAIQAATIESIHDLSLGGKSKATTKKRPPTSPSS